jgi:hypothetical protein
VLRLRVAPFRSCAYAMTESQLSDGMATAFAMVPLDPDGPLLVALKEGQLHPRDLAVLWCLLARLDWRSGRAWVTTADLAAAMGHEKTNTVCAALARLKRLALVAKGIDKRDPRRRFWCVNPLVAATGGPHRRKMQDLQFRLALE